MLAGLEWSARALDRLWPTSQVDELSQSKFIHDVHYKSVDSRDMLAPTVEFSLSIERLNSHMSLGGRT